MLSQPKTIKDWNHLFEDLIQHQGDDLPRDQTQFRASTDGFGGPQQDDEESIEE